MKDHTFSVPCMIITDFVMEARPFFESQIKIKDSSRYLLSKIPVLQQSAVGSSLVGEFSLCSARVIRKQTAVCQPADLQLSGQIELQKPSCSSEFCKVAPSVLITVRIGPESGVERGPGQGQELGQVERRGTLL